MDSIPGTTPTNPDHPDDCSSDGGRSSHAVVRVRGLPFNTTVDQVASLLHDVALADDGPSIVLTRLPDGRPTGDAYVRVASEDALSTALGYDNHKLGTRYVQVFRASMRDLHEATSNTSSSSHTLTRSSSSSGDVQVSTMHILSQCVANNTSSDAPVKPGSRTPTNSQTRGSPGGGRGGRGTSPADAPQTGPIVELRGLPFMATVDDIVAFFQGMHGLHTVHQVCIISGVSSQTISKEIKVAIMTIDHNVPQNHTSGFDVAPHDVTLPMRRDLRTGMPVNTGYAHVVFASREVASRARQARHCKMMGNRYIECLSPSHHMVLPRHQPRPDDWSRGQAAPQSWPQPVCVVSAMC